jgi:bidirectional [NiFe] hydrogenase diaphorase subunit
MGSVTTVPAVLRLVPLGNRSEVPVAATRSSPAAAIDDDRWQVVEARMRELGNRPDALIEALHSVQETYGHIDEQALQRLSERLRVPPSTVFGVATFYHYFRLRPKGERSAVVCTGTACYIDGANELLEAAKAELHVTPDETIPDGRLTLFTARCIGACSLAPAVIVDGKVIGRVSATDFVREVST